MDELSKLLQIKEYVLEVKWNLAKLHTQKVEAIRSQYYEKAAEIREKERELKTVLLDTRTILLERRLSPLPSSEQLMEHEIVLSVISELSLDNELRTTYQKIRNEFYEMLQSESKRLLKDKQEFLRIKEEWAVKEVHRQLLEIGEFLSKVGR